MMRSDDLWAALRHLRRNPRSAVLAAATLALGLTAAIAAFGLLSAVFLAPLPYPNAARLWAPYLTAQVPGQAPERARFTFPDFDSFHRSQQVFDRVAAYTGTRLPLTGAPGPDRVAAEFVSPEYFSVLGARPRIGRLFAADREAAGDAGSLLLSDRLWRRRFGADPAIVGRPVEVLGQSFTVVGVLAADFAGLLDETELWFPLATLPALWDYPDAGLALSFALLRALAVLAPPGLPGWGLSGADLQHLVQAGITLPVVLFALPVTLAATLLAGLVPALGVARRDAAAALSEGGASLAGAQGHRRRCRSSARGRRLLVSAQTAAAVVLLAAAGLLLHSLRELLAIDPGFRAGSVLALRIEPAIPYERERAPAFHRRLLDKVAQLPGVSSAALGSCMPLGCRRTTTLGSVDGNALPPGSSPTFSTQFVSPGYFRTLGIPLLAGRDFAAGDRMDSPQVAVVSQSLARRIWPQGSPLGRRLNSVSDSLDGEEVEVIGVVADARLQSLTSAPAGDLYIADAQNGASWGVLFVQTAERRAAIEAALRRTLRKVDPDLPFVVQGTVDEQLARATARNRFATALLSTIAAVALFLTLVALYGVVAQSVAGRRRELALRAALGASRGSLFRLVLRQGLLPILAGLALGTPAAWAAGRWLQALLYGAEGVAPAVYLSVLLLVIAAAALACFLPARRALGVDPAVALRYE